MGASDGSTMSTEKCEVCKKFESLQDATWGNWIPETNLRGETARACYNCRSSNDRLWDKFQCEICQKSCWFVHECSVRRDIETESETYRKGAKVQVCKYCIARNGQYLD